MKRSTRKLSLYGMLLALSIVLGYVESMIPIPLGIPGVKLGIPNIVTVIALYSIGALPAFLITLLRILLISASFGNGVTFLYSLSGFLLSFSGMLFLKKIGGFSRVSVSIAGGVLHNIGQIFSAVLLLRSSALFSYLPVLLLAGVLSGGVIGLLAGIVTERLGKNLLDK